MLSLSPSPFLISPNSLPSLIVRPISLRYSSYIFPRVFVDFLFCYIIDPIWKGLAIFSMFFLLKSSILLKCLDAPGLNYIRSDISSIYSKWMTSLCKLQTSQNGRSVRRKLPTASSRLLFMQHCMLIINTQLRAVVLKLFPRILVSYAINRDTIL